MPGHSAPQKEIPRRICRHTWCPLQLRTTEASKQDEKEAKPYADTGGPQRINRRLYYYAKLVNVFGPHIRGQSLHRLTRMDPAGLPTLVESSVKGRALSYGYCQKKKCECLHDDHAQIWESMSGYNNGRISLQLWPPERLSRRTQ